MFIELHNRHGSAFLFNTESMDTIVPGSDVEGCTTSIGLCHSEDGFVNVQETYDEVKALLAGQVVSAPRKTADLPDDLLKEYARLLTKLYLDT